MTRDEAIERLNIHKSTSVFVDSIAEAIDMAIEALHREEAEAKGYCHRIKPKEDFKEMDEQTVIDHDRDWIIGCIKHDGFIKTDRFDKANQIILEALSERNIAREIATILENEQDMRVVLQNDAIQADDRIEQNKIYCSPLVAENVEVVVRCKDCRWQHTSRKSGRQICAHHNGLIYAADDNFCSHGERSEPSK